MSEKYYNNQQAIAQLEHFTSKLVKSYSKFRNYDFGEQKTNYVSYLSASINRRIVSEKDIIAHILKFHRYNSIEKFIQEICWGTYWKGFLETHPMIWKHYLEKLENFNEKYSTPIYQNAILGKTGIECFDFWSCQLHNDGYLHNHARMWYASIWIHTLKLPWELGASHFLEHLVDGDIASNTLSWRWVAGLHTKGKTYLARADNIRKFTRGKFYPKNQLSKYPEKIQEENQAPEQRLIFDNNHRNYNKCFLIHENDLSIKIPGYCSVLFVQKKPLENLKRSKIVKSFVKESLKEISTKILKHQTIKVFFVDLEDVSTLYKIFKKENISSFETAYPRIGYIKNHLEDVSQKSKVEIVYNYSKWDRTFWPYTSKGFFKLKQQIPMLLKKLEIIQK